MTKQEEIREGVIVKVKSIRAWATRADDPLSAEDDADDILNMLHNKGVVIKVDTSGATVVIDEFAIRCAEEGVVAVEPLIGEKR